MGGTTDQYTLTAFNAANTAIATDSARPGDGVYAHLSVATANIAYVTLSTSGTAMVIDDLSFTSSAPVPEQASLLLIGSALAGLGAARRRR